MTAKANGAFASITNGACVFALKAVKHLISRRKDHASIFLLAATHGIAEVDTDRQSPSLTVVGLPDGAGRESKERVMAAAATPASA